LRREGDRRRGPLPLPRELVVVGRVARRKPSCTADDAAASSATRCSRTHCSTAFSIFCFRDSVEVVMHFGSHSAITRSTPGLNDYRSCGCTSRSSARGVLRDVIVVLSELVDLHREAVVVPRRSVVLAPRQHEPIVAELAQEPAYSFAIFFAE